MSSDDTPQHIITNVKLRETVERYTIVTSSGANDYMEVSYDEEGNPSYATVPFPSSKRFTMDGLKAFYEVIGSILTKAKLLE